MKIAAQPESDRFQSEAAKYAAYLETPEGRLRLELAFANLNEFLPHDRASLCAVDIGCGTGAMAIRLARLGVHVTLLDSSAAMLDIAQRGALETGVSDRVELKHGDAASLTSLFNRQKFDLILCHNVLEYLDDPADVLQGFAHAIRDSSAILSLLVRNQPGEVLKAAIQAGNLSEAENSLSAEWGQESLYGGKVRLFTLDDVRAMLKAASFEVIAERGVRVVTDYLPAKVSRSQEYERIFALERKLSSRPEFAAIARYTHSLARRSIG